MTAAPKTILVVDDDHDIGEAVVDILAQEGHAVGWAKNGHEALELLASATPPALILLDLMMPDLDGAAFRSLQLDRPEIAAIPVVVVSASSRIVEDAEALGAAAWLKKPFGVEDLLEVVRRYAGVPAL
ncbi:MAG: response regulator transcription factor [Deltaproteobacteria bacterium]|nr:response regulator transcription factor [Deltaproteobacteria bacterium]